MELLQLRLASLLNQLCWLKTHMKPLVLVQTQFVLEVCYACGILRQKDKSEECTHFLIPGIKLVCRERDKQSQRRRIERLNYVSKIKYAKTQ